MTVAAPPVRRLEAGVMTAAAAPRTDAFRPWARRAGGVAVLVAAACCVPGDELVLVAAALAALGVLVVAGCGVVRSWPSIAAGLLPASERAPWRAEVLAVLHAASDGRERRRQAWGFLLGLPACVVTSWRLCLGRA